MIIITNKKINKNKKITKEKGLELFNTLYEIIESENQTTLQKVSDLLKNHKESIDSQIDKIYSYLDVEDEWDSDSNGMILVKKSKTIKK